MSTCVSKKKIVILISACLLIAAVILAVCIGIRVKRVNDQLDLGMRYLEELDYVSAQLVFEGVLEIDPKNVDAAVGLASVYRAWGMYEEALSVIDDMLKHTGSERLSVLSDELQELIPKPDDIITIDDPNLAALLSYAFNTSPDAITQAHLDRITKVGYAGYMWPPVSLTLDDGTVIGELLFDADGNRLEEYDYEHAASSISTEFNEQTLRVFAKCRNADIKLDQFSADGVFSYDLLGMLKNLTSLDFFFAAVDSYDFISSLPRLEAFSVTTYEIKDLSMIFRSPSLKRLSICFDPYMMDESDPLPVIDLTGIHSLTDLSDITIEFASSIIGLDEVAALPNLVSLDLDVESIDLTQLAGASRLTDLRISGRGDTVLDTSAMSAMTALEYFRFYGCTLTEPAGLSPLTSLKTLDLSGMGLTDISFLSGMTQMEYLNLNDNAITDISALSNMSKLVHLEMNNNQIVDVTPLSGKPQLEELRMENNRITQLSGITGLTGLKYLLMYGNPVTTIEAVRDMPNLYDLRVDDTLISDWSPADHVTAINTNNDYWGGTVWK